MNANSSGPPPSRLATPPSPPLPPPPGITSEPVAMGQIVSSGTVQEGLRLTEENYQSFAKSTMNYIE